MELKKYDDKIVRIITKNNEIFEGYCVYNNKEYNECEFGIKHDGLHMQGYLIITKNEIKELSIIKDYSSPYGLLEEMIVEDGIEAIEDTIEYDEDFFPRLLNCIEDKKKKEELNIDWEKFNKIKKRIEGK